MDALQIALYLVLLLALSMPLGAYMAAVFAGERSRRGPLAWLERHLLSSVGSHAAEEQDWRAYGRALLVFNALGFVLLYALLRVQHLLPLTPAGQTGFAPDLAFDTAVSFVTNTNWQSYAGESALGPVAQMLGLAVQNFLSAATGLAVLVALVRGLVRRESGTIGSFRVDLVRGLVHVLLPLALVLAPALVACGVVQSFRGEVELPAFGDAAPAQVLALGPVASQVAIKQLGTNGGGYFNANSAHPLENPGTVSNLLQSLAILLIPCALCFSFGRLVGDRRQGLVLLATMLLVLVAAVLAVLACERAGTPLLRAAGAAPSDGNMEGKEVRFGLVQSAIWVAATTAASSGSVNAMHDSLTPLGGLVPLALMQLGEVIFGGVGSGLYGMLCFVVVAVFVSGLLVGRTPEYLGKKIGALETKLAVLAILAPCVAALAGTALACALPAGRASVQDPGPHGFSELLYAFSSAANNNGSAFAGLAADTPFLNVSLGLAMLVGRYATLVPVLALAGALARKKCVPAGPGTLPTHTPLFVVLLLGTIVLVGLLTFLPALALGPVAEELQMRAGG